METMETSETNEKKTPYQEHNFLYFGGQETEKSLDVDGTIAYLEQFGLGENPLEQARESEENAFHVEDDYRPDRKGVHYCDLCAAVITGVEYEVLDSGLERCLQCTNSALRTEEQFKRLYKTVHRNMEAFFGINLNIPVTVRMVNAKKIAKMTGMRLVPTPEFDPRVLGFARRDKEGFSLYIENGSPKIAAVATMAHELTHIWQYVNWNDRLLKRQYGARNLLEVYEGMAKWVEIQYLFYINEIAYGKRQEIITMMRNDEYGRGFIRYRQKYPLTYHTGIGGLTPFYNSKSPL